MAFSTSKWLSGASDVSAVFLNQLIYQLNHTISLDNNFPPKSVFFLNAYIINKEFVLARRLRGNDAGRMHGILSAQCGDG